MADAVWLNTETGEMVEGKCPFCAATEERCDEQVKAMERERRADRAARAKAEKEKERAQVARRDKAEWDEILAFYRHHFPDKKMTATSLKSERATAYFRRRESGASQDDVKAVIYACTVWRWISYGRRVKVPHGKAQPAIDLLDMLNDDARFDAMCVKGYEMRAEHEARGSAT